MKSNSGQRAVGPTFRDVSSFILILLLTFIWAWCLREVPNVTPLLVVVFLLLSGAALLINFLTVFVRRKWVLKTWFSQFVEVCTRLFVGFSVGALLLFVVGISVPVVTTYVGYSPTISNDNRSFIKAVTPLWSLFLPWAALIASLSMPSRGVSTNSLRGSLLLSITSATVLALLLLALILRAAFSI